MARKNYPDEFKRDAVALYRDTVGATIAVIAAELGVSEATLSAWCKAAGVAIRHRRHASAAVARPGMETAEQELARMRAQVKDMQTEKTKLATERDILRSTAKYFAGDGDRDRNSSGRVPSARPAWISGGRTVRSGPVLEAGAESNAPAGYRVSRRPAAAMHRRRSTRCPRKSRLARRGRASVVQLVFVRRCHPKSGQS